MCVYDSSTASNSSLRNNPLSTKMQNRFAPMVLCKSIAATDESTPPDKPNTTRSLPNCDCNFSIVLSINESGVQSWVHPQMPTRKLCSKCFPSTECVTSGW